MEQFSPPCFGFSSLGVNRNDTETTHFWFEGLVCSKRSMHQYIYIYNYTCIYIYVVMCIYLYTLDF